jgi:hypothetical protein
MSELAHHSREGGGTQSTSKFNKADFTPFLGQNSDTSQIVLSNHGGREEGTRANLVCQDTLYVCTVDYKGKIKVIIKLQKCVLILFNCLSVDKFIGMDYMT